MLCFLNAALVSDGRRLPPSPFTLAAGRVSRIAAVGAENRRDVDTEQPGQERRGGEIAVDLNGHLIFPGLVNAHDHLHLNVFPPTRPRERYDHSADWVADMARVIETPAMRALRHLPQALRAWHGALKNALAGTTTVVHHDPWLPVFDDPDFPVTVVRNCGWAHSLGLSGSYGPPWRESLVRVPAGRPWFIHLAEGTDARAAAELAALAAGGGLGPHTRLVHAVGLRPRDSARALGAGAAMVWCPASNAFLLGRVADPSAWIAAERAALGTDSRLTGSRDLLDELAFATDTGFCSPGHLLTIVTGIGAQLCGRPEAGRLAVGAPADLVVLRDDGRDPALQLVGARRADLRLVVAGGRPVVADPDLAAVFEIAGEAAWWAVLDGRPKLIAARVVGPLLSARIAEPGLEVTSGVASARSPAIEIAAEDASGAERRPSPTQMAGSATESGEFTRDG
jgi:cytosine/adenosine deaminase-related metal-dependent hydrolase